MIVTTLENLQIYDEEIKNYIKQLIKENSEELIVEKESFLQFPTVGKEGSIYIDTTDNKVYRFSESELKYYVIGSDCDDIKVVNGNF